MNDLAKKYKTNNNIKLSARYEYNTSSICLCLYLVKLNFFMKSVSLKY